MNSYALFADVSLNPKRKLGVGGYLLVPASFLEAAPPSIERSDVVQRLVLRRFEDTSSTQLELRTVMWALEEYRNKLKGSALCKLQVYSDSQGVAGLLRRRQRLEGTGFRSGRTHRLLKNASLYRTFYEFYDELGFEVMKVAGHTRSTSRDTVHHIFSCLDREVRKALKTWMGELAAESVESHKI